MRKYGYLCFDILSICLMLVFALFLRNGIPLIEEGQPDDLNTLLAMCLGISLLVLPALKTHTRMWRYTSIADIWTIVIAASVIVLLINSGLFLFNRLEIIPRSVPPMHWALIVCWLAGTRLMVRAMIGPKFASAKHDITQHVLIIGTGQVAELYIAFVKKIIPGQINIEGIIDENPALKDRSFHQYPIFGRPEMLPDLLEKFLVHGIHINKLVLTQPFDQLSLPTQQILLELQQHHGIELINFEQQISQYQSHSAPERVHTPRITQTHYLKPTGVYPKLKRLMDISAAFSLLCLSAPLLALCSLLIYLDIGLPLFFWQKRPGRYGKPFRLFKLRTMRPAGRKRGEDRLSHKEGDSRRTSSVGRWIRRLRVDELPQLFHIISGDMSFVGPRPLLPDDQPKNGELRLSVRPGITGWAQINGGDALTPEDKLVLDLWYIQRMSLWLDIYITLRTLVVVFKEDRRSAEVVERCRAELNLPSELMPQAPKAA